jgi:hypothetical protein
VNIVHILIYLFALLTSRHDGGQRNAASEHDEGRSAKRRSPTCRRRREVDDLGTGHQSVPKSCWLVNRSLERLDHGRLRSRSPGKLVWKPAVQSEVWCIQPCFEKMECAGELAKCIVRIKAFEVTQEQELTRVDRTVHELAKSLA